MSLFKILIPSCLYLLYKIRFAVFLRKTCLRVKIFMPFDSIRRKVYFLWSNLQTVFVLNLYFCLFCCYKFNFCLSKHLTCFFLTHRKSFGRIFCGRILAMFLLLFLLRQNVNNIFLRWRQWTIIRSSWFVM